MPNISVPIECPECGTTTHASIGDVKQTMKRHNQKMHNGEKVARIRRSFLKDVLERFADKQGIDLDRIDE